MTKNNFYICFAMKYKSAKNTANPTIRPVITHYN